MRSALRGAAEGTDPLDFGRKLSLLGVVIRWVAIATGVLIASIRDDVDEVLVVTTAALCLYTLVQTVRPLALERTDRVTERVVALELVLTVVALGATGGIESPFLLLPVVPTMVAGFVWGARAAAGIAIGGAGVALWVILAEHDPTAQRSAAELSVVFLLCGGLGALARTLVQEVEQRHTAALDQMTRMATANDLLVSLHGIAQTLPASLDLGEVLESIRVRLRSLFTFTALTVVVRDETTGQWRVELAEGVRLASPLETPELPSAIRQVADDALRPVLVEDLLRSPLDPCAPLARSGLYAPMRARGGLVGLLALEHGSPGHYEVSQIDLLASLASLFALAIDNALWFARLRRFGAEAERARIARELHDSVAQSLAYIAFELERLAEREAEADDGRTELAALHDVVRGVVADLRETLYQLRSTVTEEVALPEVAERSLGRFRERTGIAVTWDADVDRRLPHQVEQEVWRILQEAMTNVERHSGAARVAVRWSVLGSKARLEVSDDGRGFLPLDVDGEHYGLLGMRERADAIGAQLVVESEPGAGTRIVLEVTR
jgi:signal transduction histidine kinase